MESGQTLGADGEGVDRVRNTGLLVTAGTNGGTDDSAWRNDSWNEIFMHRGESGFLIKMGLSV